MGANFWDAPGHSMAGSNDAATRKQIFDWIALHEKTLYRPRTPYQPVGIYFSPASRNFDPARFLSSYRGTVVLLLQNHLEFQVVTPRTISGFRGRTLILPDVSVLDAPERDQLRTFLARHGRLVVSGVDGTGFQPAENIIPFTNSPGSAYLSALEKDFVTASRTQPAEFLAALTPSNDLIVSAPPMVASNTALVDGQPHVFLVNFAGIVPHHSLKPTTEKSVTITVPAAHKCVMHFLPFLGEEQRVSSKRAGDSQIFSLPEFDRGAVAWLEDTQ